MAPLGQTSKSSESQICLKLYFFFSKSNTYFSGPGKTFKTVSSIFLEMSTKRVKISWISLSCKIGKDLFFLFMCPKLSETVCIYFKYIRINVLDLTAISFSRLCYVRVGTYCVYQTKPLPEMDSS